MSGLDRRFDAIVVGSGAAGSIAVKELTERGLDVLLLEAGRDLTDQDFVPPPPARPRALGPGLGPRVRAGLRGQPIQARRAFFSPAISPFLVDDRKNPYSTPKDKFYLWIRGRILGGRLNSYGRVLLRMSDYDFKGASRDGQAVDWPISYADLEPHYDRVEQFIGVYGNADGVPQLPDGTYCGPAKLNEVEREFKQKVEEHWPERNVVAWRYAAPNPHRVPRGIVAARETGRLTLRTDAVVKTITVDEKTGLADGAVFVDRVTKQEHRVSADVVVLCASTIESVRLLLNSASERHPNGLGNSSGLLGQYFMDQTPSLAFGTVPGRPGYWEGDDTAPPDEFYSPAGGIYVPRAQNLDGGAAGAVRARVRRPGRDRALPGAGDGRARVRDDGLRRDAPAPREPDHDRPEAQGRVGRSGAAHQPLALRQRARDPARAGSGGPGDDRALRLPHRLHRLDAGARREERVPGLRSGQPLHLPPGLQQEPCARRGDPRVRRRAHGIGSRDLGAQRAQPVVGRAEPLRHGRQLLPVQRDRRAGADDHGAHRASLRAHRARARVREPARGDDAVGESTERLNQAGSADGRTWDRTRDLSRVEGAGCAAPCTLVA